MVRPSARAPSPISSAASPTPLLPLNPLRHKDGALVPLAIAIVAGGLAALAIFAFAPSWWPTMLRVVAVYDVAVAAMLVLYWYLIAVSDVATTQARAAAEDPGRNLAFAVV